MPNLVTQLLNLYLPLVGWTLLGWPMGRYLPKTAPTYLGRFLFWFGVPASILAFLRGADLSGQIWIAPIIAWVAILLGAGLAWLWSRHQPTWSKPTQGSFLLASMVGTTGYLGFPIALALGGQQLFAWALFYDMLGTTWGAYGLGVVLASRLGLEGTQSRSQLTLALLKNPALWSFALGLSSRNVPLPSWLETSLHQAGWSAIVLALVLIGMRLSQLPSLSRLDSAAVSLAIKMIVVPLTVSLGLPFLPIGDAAKHTIVLQMAMPPAFATLVLAETYGLDQDLAVTALAVGSIGLLFMLPVWLWLFSL